MLEALAIAAASSESLPKVEEGMVIQRTGWESKKIWKFIFLDKPCLKGTWAGRQDGARQKYPPTEHSSVFGARFFHSGLRTQGDQPGP